MTQMTLWDFSSHDSGVIRDLVYDCTSWDRYPGYHIFVCPFDDEMEWSLYLDKDGANLWEEQE